MKYPGTLVGGMILGAGLGIAAGILMAPRAGKQSRKKLAMGSKKIKREVTNYVENSLEELRRQFNAKIDQLAGKGKQAINHASEHVKV